MVWGAKIHWIENFLISLEKFLYVNFKNGFALSIWIFTTQFMAGKKGRKLKCQFDSQPLKIKNHLELHAWRNFKIQSIIDWTKIFILDSKKNFKI